MKMSTFGPLKSESPDFKESVTKALNNLGNFPQVAIIYPSIKTDIKKVVDVIKSVAAVPVIGATTGGAGFTEKGIALEGVVGAFIGGADVDIQIATIKNLGGDLEHDIGSTIKSFRPSNLRGHTLFVFADAMACDGEKLVQTIANEIPLHWRIFGGFAGDGWKFTGTKVIYDDEIFATGGVLMLLNSDITPGIGVRHGFCPLANAPEMKITAIDGNILKSINGRPALEVYKEFLIRSGLYTAGQDIIPLLATYPIGMKTMVGEKWRIRSPIGVQDQAMLLAGSIPNGSNIKIMVAEKKDLLAAAKETVSIASRGLAGRSPVAQFVIDCAIRKQLMENQYTDQIKSFRISPNCPMLGFASYGEFARYGGSLEGFHNTTAITAVW